MPDEPYIRFIKRALHHLYDPTELELNPLAGLLGIYRGDVPSVLRKTLLDGINALKPDPRIPADSNAWRVYQVLCYRFEEQSSQEDVASQMAVSPRQVRRLEYAAVRALAKHIAMRYGLDSRIQSTQPDASTQGGKHAQELDFLRKSYPHETTAIATLVDSALKTVEGMLNAALAIVKLEIPAALPLVRGQATTLRQVLLNLLLAAIHAGKQPIITLNASAEQGKIWIMLSAEASEFNQPPANVSEFLVLARSLAELSEGTLELPQLARGQALAVRLGLPVAEQIRVLFVDDNEDSLRLSARFLDGTHFLFHATRDPHRALSAAEEAGAQIIVLDIMLPDIDGWEVLGRIRAHPRLGNIPVIISTILPHEALATSLGAAGFLRKPVTREALLAMLSRLNEAPPPS